MARLALAVLAATCENVCDGAASAVGDWIYRALTFLGNQLSVRTGYQYPA